MKKLSIAFALIFLAACGASKPSIKPSEASMDRLTSATKIWGHHVIHELPVNWKVIDSSQKGNMFTQLYLPANKTGANWDRNFQITGVKFNVSDNVDLRKNALKGIIQSQMYMVGSQCRKNKISLDLGEKDLGMEVVGYHAILGCKNTEKDLPRMGLKKGMSEVAYLYGISTGQDLYLFQSSLRGDGLHLNDVKIKERIRESVQDFFPMSLCPVGKGAESCLSVPNP
jgi:hypothetical protein